MTSSPRLWRAAQLALLASPVLLAGCYVVPIVPGVQPVYRPYYPKPHHHRHQHRHWRGDVAPAAAGSFALASERGVDAFEPVDAPQEAATGLSFAQVAAADGLR